MLGIHHQARTLKSYQDPEVVVMKQYTLFTGERADRGAFMVEVTTDKRDKAYGIVVRAFNRLSFSIGFYPDGVV